MSRCDVVTRFHFPSLEPVFSAYMTLVRDYNLGWGRCAAGEDDPWFHRFPLVTYLRNVTDPSQYTDDLHMEVNERDKQWEQYEFRCNVVANPKEQDLTKFGIDEKMDILLYPCLPILESVGLAVQKPGEIYVGPRKVVPDPYSFENGPIDFLMNPGDRVWWANRLFEVQSVVPWQFFGNTNIPMYVTIAANLYRPDSTELEYGRTV